MSWRSLTCSLVILLLLLGMGALRADEARGDETIAWSPDLTTAFAKAKEDQKVLMICINAKHVAGRAREEPAAKGLREVVYLDPRVVAKSREFVCALLTTEGSAADYGELRALEISGDLVSPQHLFIHPDGTKILLRREYWPYGKDERGVQALLDLMAKAQQRLTGEGESPEAEPPAEVDGPPDDPAERAAWIQDLVQKIVNGDAATQKGALDSLIQHDQAGDCWAALVSLFDTEKKNTPLIVWPRPGVGA